MTKRFEQHGLIQGSPQSKPAIVRRHEQSTHVGNGLGQRRDSGGPNTIIRQMVDISWQGVECQPKATGDSPLGVDCRHVMRASVPFVTPLCDVWLQASLAPPRFQPQSTDFLDLLRREIAD